MKTEKEALPIPSEFDSEVSEIATATFHAHLGQVDQAVLACYCLLPIQNSKN